jgi:plastocyanin
MNNSRRIFLGLLFCFLVGFVLAFTQTETALGQQETNHQSHNLAGNVPSRSAANHTVNVAGLTFSPSVITITVGDTVEWMGLNGFHTVTSVGGSFPDSPSGAMTHTVTFSQTGTFDYFCVPHQGLGMTGRVVVQPATSPTPTTTPNPSVTPAATATRIVLDKAISPQKDTSIFSENNNASNGAGQSLYVGRTGNTNGGNLRRSIVAFDLASIPSGSTVYSASLELSHIAQSQSGSQLFELHKALANWGEAGSFGSGTGGQAQPNDATWQHRFYTSTLWSGLGGDFVLTSTASTSVDANGRYTFTTSPQMVGDAQSWVNNATNNFGWFILGNEGSLQTAKQFASKENATVENRPLLRIHYSPPLNTSCFVYAVAFAPETPSTVTSASGNAVLVLDTTQNTLKYTIVYTNLTSAETNAHFHSFTPPATTGSPIAGQPLAAGASPKIGVWNYGSLANAQTIENDLLAGRIYINIHTANYPSGEIRADLLSPTVCKQVYIPLVNK